MIYVSVVSCKSGRSCLSPGLCFPSALRIDRATPGPLTQLHWGETLRILMLASTPKHMLEALCEACVCGHVNACVCFYFQVFACVCIQHSLCFSCRLIKEEMSTCALKHLVLCRMQELCLSFHCYHLQARRGKNPLHTHVQTHTHIQ